MDLSLLCRSCMKEVASWERENFDPKAVEMFCFCTNIKVFDGDTLPKQFCYDCTIKIESAYTFITEALKVNVTLKNIISNTNIVITVQPDLKNTEGLESRLTLPECKISSTIENYSDIILNALDYVHLNESEPEKVPEQNVLNNHQERVCEEKKDIKVEEKKNVCPVCHKGFTSKAWFNKHMVNEHNGQKYMCNECSKTFNKITQLKSHMTTHAEDRKFICSTCGKRYKHRKQLTTHLRAHSDVRPYACETCNKRFKLKSVLKCHMKVHSDKQYLCSYCGWSFAQASNLAVHIRSHTGEKPHACGVCGFRAAASSSLRRHARAHARARTHLCAHCGKGFYDASALGRHRRTHTGELPYQCPGCARAFPDSWKRKTHLMRAHRLALHDIPRMRRDGRTLN
ncbi:zinc finger protein 664 [Bombyx mori]|uniref:Uncharacterized protein n=1 Tax=Bombyx mori TaxID=7091 RepID=A0A8R1WIC3_BOMMO|nr:zinc finger protein 664 [Bombyx mori]